MLPEPYIILEKFFFLGEVPANAETGTYVLPFVILSYVIASLGSFAGLRLASEIHNVQTGILKKVLHLGGALAFGSSIWSMHFIGMLAYDMNMWHSYDPFLTVLSMIIAVVIAYGVLQIIRAGVLKIKQFAAGAVLLGIAICGMHYTGMAAMEMDGDLRYTPFLFFLSVLIAIIASGAALWIVLTLGQHKGRRKILWQSAAALVMGAAICGMHYTGMAAAVFVPYADCRYDPDQDFTALALSVSLITFLVLGLTVIFSTLIQDTSHTEGEKIMAVRKYSIYVPVFLVLLLGAIITSFANYFVADYQKNLKRSEFIEASEDYKAEFKSVI